MTRAALRDAEPSDSKLKIHLDTLSRHLESLGIPGVGRAYILRVASSPPSRAVGESRARNLCSRVPIPHLGVVLQTESESGEHFFLLELSRDRGLIGIYDQPENIPVQITNKRGIRTHTTHTPDFLVVHQDRVVAYEIKCDEKLQKMCRERGADWFTDNGNYIYRPAQQYFASLGIHHLVFPNSAISSIRADNLRMLASVRITEDTPRLARLRKKIMAIAIRCDLVCIGSILDELEIEDTTAIFQLIDQGDLHADLDKCLLASPRNLWVALNPALLTAVDEQDFCLKQQVRNQSCIKTSDVPDPKHIGEVAARFAACGLLESSQFTTNKAARTKRRWIKSLSQAGGNPAALFPGWSKSGNRAKRFSEEHERLAWVVIDWAKGDPNLATPAVGYREFVARFKEQEALTCDIPMSKATFYAWFAIYRGSLDLALRQGGRRLSNAMADSIDPLRKATLQTRAFQCAQFDHYQVDIAVIVGYRKGEPLTLRPWLTVMVDCYTGEILGIWLSFKHPCRQSCAMAVRDCAFRHGRLPEQIIVDGGPDLVSAHFQVMLAMLNVTWTNRPPEDPRFGGEVERTFGTVKEQFARGQAGFVPAIGTARKISGKLSASKRAKLTFQDLLKLTEQYIFDGYNHETSVNDSDSRIALRGISEKTFPFSGRKVVLDTRFLILSAIEAPADSYEIAQGRGIRVYGKWYSCKALRTHGGWKKDVRVKLETLDYSIIYICIKDYWFVCRCNNALINEGLPRTEVIALTSEHQQLRRIKNALAMESQQATYELRRPIIHEIIQRNADVVHLEHGDVRDFAIDTTPNFEFDYDAKGELLTDEDVS